MSPIQFEDFDLDRKAYELRRGGGTLRLGSIPMEILLLLIEHGDQLVTREQIVERVGRGRFRRNRQQHQCRHPQDPDRLGGRLGACLLQRVEDCQ